MSARGRETKCSCSIARATDTRRGQGVVVLNRRVALILWLLGTVIVALAVIWLIQRRLVYFPSHGPVPPAASFLPNAEEVTFATEDGLRLGAWFVRPSRPVRGTVLVLKSWRGELHAADELAQALELERAEVHPIDACQRAKDVEAGVDEHLVQPQMMCVSVLPVVFDVPERKLRLT
jgi:hypothetical protein